MSALLSLTVRLGRFQLSLDIDTPADSEPTPPPQLNGGTGTVLDPWPCGHGLGFRPSSGTP